MNEYKHTQIGYFLIGALGAAVLFIGYLNFITRFNPGTVLVLIFMILCLITFATLTVQVNSEAVTIRFGMGVIRRHFVLRDIQSCHAVRNPWYYAWGIHAIPNGLIFNVSGWEAVELQMRDGKKYRIGTDDAQGLMRVIETSIRGTT